MIARGSPFFLIFATPVENEEAAKAGPRIWFLATKFFWINDPIRRQLYLGSGSGCRDIKMAK